jgi:hypothetical protein
MEAETWHGQYETIRVDASDGVATITIDRPHARNSMTPQMAREMLDAVQRIAMDHSLHVVVTGDGNDAFCPGTDTKAFASGGPDPGLVSELLLDQQFVPDPRDLESDAAGDDRCDQRSDGGRRPELGVCLRLSLGRTHGQVQHCLPGSRGFRRDVSELDAPANRWAGHSEAVDVLPEQVRRRSCVADAITSAVSGRVPRRVRSIRQPRLHLTLPSCWHHDFDGIGR